MTTTSSISSTLRALRRADDPRLPPALPGGVPFLGHALEFWQRPVELLSRGRERYGEIFRFHLAGRDVNVMTGPKANTAFFQAPEKVLSARECYQFTTPVFGQGVAYDVPSDVMEQQLSWVHPALSEKRLRTYAQVMGEEAEAYFERWADATALRTHFEVPASRDFARAIASLAAERAQLAVFEANEVSVRSLLS